MSERLLIIDDEPNVLRAVASILRNEGFEVKTARNGKTALRQIAKSLPDLIVSDIGMPVMDGFELARRLRSAPHFSLIPIVFLTGKIETEDRVEGFRSGIDAYLTKPFNPDELIAVIRGILLRIERTHNTIARLVGDEHSEDLAIVRDEEFTAAEWRIAIEIARGRSNKEIAAELGLSVRTVENHVSRILAKKNFSNRVEIARHLLTEESESRTFER